MTFSGSLDVVDFCAQASCLPAAEHASTITMNRTFQAHPRPVLISLRLARPSLRFSATKSSTSACVGMEGSAPRRVTEIAAAAVANSAACRAQDPRASATAKAPLNASPAAVVSAALTGYAGIRARIPSWAARYAPRSPIFSSTLRGPSFMMLSASCHKSSSGGARSLLLVIWLSLNLVGRNPACRAKKVFGQMTDGRRIEHQRYTFPIADLRQVPHCGQWNLELSQNYAGAAEQFEIRIQIAQG